MEGKPVSILRRGGEDGIVMGIWLIVMFAAMMAGVAGNLLSVVAFAMVITTPLLAYRRLRSSYVDSRGVLTFSAVWFQGILMFIGASLFLAVAAFVFFRLIDPSFIPAQVETMARLYQSSDAESLREFGDMLQTMIERHMLPRPIEVAVSMAWLGAFSGSMLSMILAVIVKAVKIRPNY